MLNIPRWKMILTLVLCALGLFISVVNMLPENKRGFFTETLGVKTLNLGLDLRGGAYLLLEADFNSYLADHMESLQDDIRTRLREAKLQYTSLSANKAEKFVSFGIQPDAKDKLKTALADLFSSIEYDVSADGQVKAHYREEYINKMRRDVMGQSIEIVRRRVDESGTKEPIIQRQGDDRIILQLPGLENPEQLKRVLGKTAKLTFHLMNETQPFSSIPVKPLPGEMVLQGEDRGDGRNTYYVVKRRAIITGDMLVQAAATFEQGKAVVSFRFNQQGGKKFGEVTSENVNKPFAIVLDGVVISAPVIQGPILGGSGIITGNFTAESANDLALLLRAGALPVPLKILEERTVGPSLGADSIASGKQAFLIGFVTISLIMLFVYKRFGFYSVLALIVNMVLVIGVLSLFQATLTMPGIAGMVLTMGMAVDANVLIFERIKEEIKEGKTPYAAIDLGFREALRTIFDSNITTLAATVLLFMFGSGPVKGFAVTLTIGVLCSMFSAISFTRLLIVLWLRKARPTKLVL